MLTGLWFLGVAVLAPLLTRPMYAFALVGALIAVWLASKSVAYPLALAGIPVLLTALNGTNPLPKGGATFLTGAWVGIAIGFVVLRGEHRLAVRALWSLPVAMACLVLGLMVLRLGPSPDAAYGSTKLQLYVADNLVALVGAIFVGTTRDGVKRFLIVTLVVLSAGAFLLLVQLVTGGAQQQYGGRFTINAQQGAINLGRDSATGALIAISLILMLRSSRARLAASAVLPVLLIALVAAGSRGPMLSFIVGLTVLIALTAATGRARQRLLLVLAGLVAAAAVIPVIVPGSAIARSLSAIVGGSSGLSSNGRSSLWSEAFSSFGQHAFFGVGTGGFAAIDPIELYPHNLLLELAVELGLLGAAAALTMIAGMLHRLAVLWRATSGREQLEVTLIVALMITALVNAMFSGAIQDNTDIWLWGGLGIGMYARVNRRTKPRRPQLSPRR